MNLVYAGLLGSLTGLHTATWGAFKDAPFEGFRTTSFLRSVLLGLVVAIGLATGTRVESTQSAVVLVGLLYAAERLVTEWWKSFVREDDQDAYSIPMRFAVAGRTVDRRLPRYALGLTVAVGLVVGCVAASALQSTRLAAGWELLLVGGAGGWLTAVGGAWKDAPVEGFSGWKFLRSPVVATAWALLLTPFTDNLLVLAVSSGGLSVAVIETYKTFLSGGRPPGKFAGKPVRWPHSTALAACRLAHSALYLVFSCGIGGVLLVGGLGATAFQAPKQQAALLAMVVLASNVALLVALSPVRMRSWDVVGADCLGARFAMLAVGNSSAAWTVAAAREPDADADLRGESPRARVAESPSEGSPRRRAPSPARAGPGRHRQECPAHGVQPGAGGRRGPEGIR